MGSCRSPERTRPRLLPGSPVPGAAGGSLTPEPAQLLALATGQPVGAAALITLGLGRPVADRLRRRLELPRQLLGRAPSPEQLNHLPAELRRIWRSGLRHRGLLSSQVFSCPRKRVKPIRPCLPPPKGGRVGVGGEIVKRSRTGADVQLRMLRRGAVPPRRTRPGDAATGWPGPPRTGRPRRPGARRRRRRRPRTRRSAGRRRPRLAGCPSRR